MRKILLLSTVFAMSLTVFAQNDVRAQISVIDRAHISATNDVETAVRDNTQEITTEVNERFMDLYGELRRMSEQQTTTNLANQANSNAIGTARGTQAAIVAQQQAGVDTEFTWVNAAGHNCVVASSGIGGARVNEEAETETNNLIQTRMRNINSEAGTDAENGLVDFQRRMFQRSTSLCDPSGNGGSNTFCTGSGNAHVSLSTILTADAFHNVSPLTERLEYIQDLLFSRIPVSVNPDLLDQPNTEAMNMVVEADRIKAEMSVGQTLFSMLQGNRTKVNSRVSTSLRERLEAGGWSSAKIDAMMAGGVSKNSMYHALTVGSYSSEMLLERVTARPRDLLANIFGELALNNVLQFEQYKLLEAIALATATNVVVNRDDAIKDLNARITALNSRQ